MWKTQRGKLRKRSSLRSQQNWPLRGAYREKKEYLEISGNYVFS